jgi:hypothetical protein
VVITRFSTLVILEGMTDAVAMGIFSVVQPVLLSHFRIYPPPHPQPLTTTNLFSVSMDLSVLNLLYKWSHPVCGLSVWFPSLGVMFLRFLPGVAIFLLREYRSHRLQCAHLSSVPL